MKCPICSKSGITAAHILGHGGAGVPKKFTRAERRRRSAQMQEINARRKGIGEMDDAEFEAWLKKNKITGMGAVAAAQKRRALRSAK